MRNLILLLTLVACLAPLWAQGRGGRRQPSWERMQRMDADGDGKVSRDEFRGPDWRWQMMDTDGDGFATETEFGEAMGSRSRDRSEPESEEAEEAESADANGESLLRALDRDEDGSISPEEAARLFTDADTDGNGKLSAEELAAWLERGGGAESAPAIATEGRLAPDFELVALDQFTPAPGRSGEVKKDSGKKTRLSSLRGKPVFMIFGSYT